MSNTSVRPIPTLKGIFSVPRVTQSRNFLKENKVSLRSLEKSTSQKLAAKEPTRPKWMPPLRRSSSVMGDSKAEKPAAKGKTIKQNSLQNGRSTSRSQHQLAVAVPAEGERFDGLEERNPILYDPSENLESENLQEPSSDTDIDRCQSCGTNRSSTSIAIQTEDITDELYLTNALKKYDFLHQTRRFSQRFILSADVTLMPDLYWRNPVQNTGKTTNPCNMKTRKIWNSCRFRRVRTPRSRVASTCPKWRLCP
uniref:RE05287p n=1 Tax=Drosophila melanogaster TaxID=7227 RepID=Q86P09_DROME|nr:RE05287p [Drosophila melanogaster]